MAIGPTAVHEVRTSGSDSNGGFFVPGTVGTTDYSQQDSPVLSLSDVVSNGTTTVTSALGGFTSQMVNNGINIAGTPVQITAYTNTNTITVDRTMTAATGQSGNVGGALASPGKACGAMASGNDLWIKSGTYLITSTTANVSGGRLDPPAGVDRTNYTRILGYQTTRGDGGTKPVIRASGAFASAILIYPNNKTAIHLENLEVDGNNLTAVGGIYLYVTATGSRARRCTIRNCKNFGLVLGSYTAAIECEITGCSVVAAVTLLSAGARLIGCVVRGNTITGVSAGSVGLMIHRCLIYGNSGASSDGIDTTSGEVVITASTIYNNGRHGVNAGGTGGAATILNSICYGNGGWGVATDRAEEGVLLYNCAGGNNASGNYNTAQIPSAMVEGFQALSADPFVNAAGNNFALNNTAGGGALLRGAGIPGAFPGGLTTGYPDIGAAQSQAAGGGVLLPFPMDGGYSD